MSYLNTESKETSTQKRGKVRKRSRMPEEIKNEYEQLIGKYQWSISGILITFVLFGLVSFIGQRMILSTMILKNKIGLNTYQNATYNFQLIIGIIASFSLAVFFIIAILGSRGLRRAGFIVGAFSSIAPIFGALATVILFRILRLPSMGAGSVIASAASAILISLPCFIMMILFAFCKKLKPGSRLWSMLISVLSLIIAIFPAIATALALVIAPGNLTAALLMQFSSYLIYLRPIVIAVSIGVVFYGNR